MYVLLNKRAGRKIKQNEQEALLLERECKRRHHSSDISFLVWDDIFFPSNFKLTLSSNGTFVFVGWLCYSRSAAPAGQHVDSQHDLCSHYCAAAPQIISWLSHNPTRSVSARWCHVRNGLLDHIQHQNLQDRASHWERGLRELTLKNKAINIARVWKRMLPKQKRVGNELHVENVFLLLLT